MILPVSNIQNILRTYDRQLRVASLNSEAKRAVIQGQVDRVEISEEGRQMLEKKPQAADNTTPMRNPRRTEGEPLRNVDSQILDTVEDDDF